MVVAGVQQFAHLTLRIIKIAKVHAVRGTDRNASRIHPLFHSVDTESALTRVAVGMDEAGIVGTGRKTGLAANAFFFRYEDNAADRVDMACTGRTAMNTGRIIAVIAALAPYLHPQVRHFAAGLFHDPIAAETLRNRVLGFAGNNAIHAADALARINDHSITRHLKLPPFPV